MSISPSTPSFALDFSRPLWLAFAGAALVAGCGGGLWPELVDTRSLSGGGAPVVRRIRDLGTKAPVGLGEWSGEPDGVASPGELLLIEGSGFGRQPTVAIDKRPAEVVARTSGGGIVARVPLAVGTGPREVEVTVGDLHATGSFPLRRLAVVLHGERLHVLAVEPQKVTPVGPPIAVPGARAVRLSPDGSVAYVAGGKQLRVIDLGAAGAPKVLYVLDLALDAWGLAVAARAPVLFAVGDGQVQSYDLRIPRQPARWDAVALPAEAKGARRVDIDPDGRRLALLIPDGNRLVLVDVQRPLAPRLVATTDLLPGEKVPLCVDLRFEGDGETVWVLGGDNPASAAIGPQPTRITAVRVEGGPDDTTARVLRTTPIPEAWAPLSLLLLRAPPPVAGTAIRLPPDAAKLHFTAANRALASARDAGAVAAAFGASPGALEQASLAGEGGHVAKLGQLVGAIDSAGSFAVGAAVAVSGFTRDFGVTTLSVDGAPSGGFVRLEAAREADLTPPFPFADLRVQP